eukprot:g1796.t1
MSKVSVDGAGVDVVNGLYSIGPDSIPDGFAKTCVEMGWDSQEMWDKLYDTGTPWFKHDDNDSYIYRNKLDGRCTSSMSSKEGDPSASSDVDVGEEEFRATGIKIPCRCGSSEDFKAGEEKTIVVHCGDGSNSIKWLGLACAQKFNSLKQSKGRLRQRGFDRKDKRQDARPIPLSVTVSKTGQFLHPGSSVSEVSRKYGKRCELKVIVGVDLKPGASGAVERPLWADVAFGGDAGQARYQRHMEEELAAEAARRKTGADDQDGDSDDGAESDEDDAQFENDSEDGAESDEEDAQFENDWRGVQIKQIVQTKMASDRQKVRAHMRSNYVSFVHAFDHATNRWTGLEGTGKADLVSLVLFCHFHDLGRTSQGGGRQNVAVLSLDDIAGIAKKCIQNYEEGWPLLLSFPKFMEFLIRLAVFLGQRKKSGSLAVHRTVSAQVKVMCSTVVPIIERRKGERVRKKIASSVIRAILTDMYSPLISVFIKYCGADSEKKASAISARTMNVREFRLLMTDCLLLGDRPGDDTMETRAAATTAFFVAQANDESAGLAFSSLTPDDRAKQSNVCEFIGFCEYVEAIARVALSKWDDDEISDVDKIQLAYEAVAVLAD